MFYKLPSDNINQVLSFNSLSCHLKCYRLSLNFQKHYHSRYTRKAALCTIDLETSTSRFHWFTKSRVCLIVCKCIIGPYRFFHKRFIQWLYQFKNLSELKINFDQRLDSLRFDEWSSLLAKITSLEIKCAQQVSETLLTPFINHCVNLQSLVLTNAVLINIPITVVTITSVEFYSCCVNMALLQSIDSLETIRFKLRTNIVNHKAFETICTAVRHFAFEPVTNNNLSLMDMLPNNLLSLEYYQYGILNIQPFKSITRFQCLKILTIPYSVVKACAGLNATMKYLPKSVTRLSFYNMLECSESNEQTFYINEVDENIYTIQTEKYEYLTASHNDSMVFLTDTHSKFAEWKIDSVSGFETTIVSAISNNSLHPSISTFNIRSINDKYNHFFIETSEGFVLQSSSRFPATDSAVYVSPKSNSIYVPDFIPWLDLKIYFESVVAVCFDNLPQLQECNLKHYGGSGFSFTYYKDGAVS